MILFWTSALPEGSTGSGRSFGRAPCSRAPTLGAFVPGGKSTGPLPEEESPYGLPHDDFKIVTNNQRRYLQHVFLPPGLSRSWDQAATSYAAMRPRLRYSDFRFVIDSWSQATMQTAISSDMNLPKSRGTYATT